MKYLVTVKQDYNSSKDYKAYLVFEVKAKNILEALNKATKEHSELKDIIAIEAKPCCCN